jgi:hypothetical protein
LSITQINKVPQTAYKKVHPYRLIIIKMKFAAIIFSAYLIASAAAVAVNKPAPAKSCCTNGDIVCSKDKEGFNTCVHGKWVYRSCGPYAECVLMYKGDTPKDDKTLVYCGYPVAPIAPTN